MQLDVCVCVCFSFTLMTICALLFKATLSAQLHRQINYLTAFPGDTQIIFSLLSGGVETDLWKQSLGALTRTPHLIPYHLCMTLSEPLKQQDILHCVIFYRRNNLGVSETPPQDSTEPTLAAITLSNRVMYDIISPSHHCEGILAHSSLQHCLS